MRSLHRFGLLLGFILSLPCVASAVTTVDQVCTGDPCVLGATITIDNGTGLLDFGTREFRISRSGRMRVVAGSVLAIRARTIVLDAGSLIDHAAGAVSNGADISLSVTGDIQLLKSGPSRARIDLSGDLQGGSIHLDADGSIDDSGFLRVEGTALGGDGGSVELTAGADITVAGDINLQGAGQGSGGALDVTAVGRLIMAGNVNASGGSEGGDINLQGGSLVLSTGNLDASGNDFPSDGGAVTIAGSGDVTLGGKILTFARGGFGGDSGDGGEISVSAGGTLIEGAVITATGGGEDGQGADVDLDAGTLVRVTADIDTHARGAGGAIAIIGDSASIEAQINADGTDGGEVSVSTGRTTVVAGPVVVTAAGNVHVDGAQGTVTLEGCDVSVPAHAQVTANGSPAGDINLRASGQMTVAGTLAARPDGHNLLQYRDVGRPPVTVGADIQPVATIQQVANMLPCPGAPVCGNNTREPGEGCDDGNTTACDVTHCSATCQREVCGNHTKECAEQCDDGNTVEGDGCDSNCTTSRCGNGITAGTEECDDGNTVDGDGCDSNCRRENPPGCGDNDVQPPEQCDDGNDTRCDGCDQCIVEECGNGFQECAEQCDDHNTENCDGCSSTCQVEHLCGNGVRDCDEQCDEGDRNGQLGVECTATCRNCTPGSGPECPCAANIDCNIGGLCAGFECQEGLCASVAPAACSDDGNVCNGVQSCDPEAGCVAGAPPACDDGDACTDDSCDPVAACPHPLLPGFSGLSCRVSSLSDTVNGAAAGDISRSVQKKLKKVVAKVRGGAGKAEKARKAKKATKLLAMARKQLGKVGGIVNAALNAHKIEPGLAARLLHAAGITTDALDKVSGSLATAQ